MRGQKGSTEMKSIAQPNESLWQIPGGCRSTGAISCASLSTAAASQQLPDGDLLKRSDAFSSETDGGYAEARSCQGKNHSGR